ncbi:MAG: hypothetical protein ACI4W7_06840, partial [Candidatus Spyradenecus sp.]
MTHFVRFAMVGVMVAGASLCTLAQDDDLDALLGDLAVEDVAAEPVGEPATVEEPAVEEPVAAEPAAEEPAEEVESEADEPAVEDEPAPEAEPEEEPAPEVEPADEPVAEEEPADEPATDEPMDDATEEPIAEEPAPEVEPVPVAEVEPTEEPAAEPAADGLLAGMTDDTAQVAELTEEEKALNDLEMLIRLKNEGLDNHAKACLIRARKLMAAAPATLAESAEYYDEIIRLYSDAELYFREHEGNLPLKQECEKGKLEALYRKAKDLFLNKEYKAAAALADEV